MGPTAGQDNNPGIRGRFRRGLWFAAAAAFLPTPAFAQSLLAERDLVLAAVTTGAVALAVAAALWAVAEQKISGRLKRALRIAGARTRAAVGERDALLSAGKEALVVWGRDGSGPYSYGGAEAVIESCLHGDDAIELSRALDALSEKAESFALSAHDRNGHVIHLRGRAVGGMAAVWLEPDRATKSHSIDFRAMLDALPVPVWLRDRSLALRWSNRAFAEAGGAADAEQAVASQITLEKSEPELAATARRSGHVHEARRFAVVAGQRRALAFTHVPLESGAVVGSAVDVTENVQADAKLQQHLDAHSDTLDRLATAVAIFGRDQKLNFYNRAFAKLWGLPETWLDSHPSDGEILDRLREGRRLPEQRDYQAWKRQRLGLYVERAENLAEETLASAQRQDTARGGAAASLRRPHLPLRGRDRTHHARKLLQHAHQGAVRDAEHAAGRRRCVRAGRKAQVPQRLLRAHLGTDAEGSGRRAACAHHRRRLRREIRRHARVGRPHPGDRLRHSANSASWATSSATTASSFRWRCRRCRTARCW